MIQVLKLSEIKKFGKTKSNRLYSSIISIRYTLQEIYIGRYIIHNDLHPDMVIVQDTLSTLSFVCSLEKPIELPDIFDKVCLDYYFLAKRNTDDLKILLFMKEEFRE